MLSTRCLARIRRRRWHIGYERGLSLLRWRCSNDLRKIQLDGEGRAFAFFAFKGNLAVVVQNDVLGVGQPQTCPFWLIGKIGFEDAGLGFFGNARTVVCDLDDAFAFFAESSQAEDALARLHGFDSVDDDIEEGDLDAFHVDGDVADDRSRGEGRPVRFAVVRPRG